MSAASTQTCRLPTAEGFLDALGARLPGAIKELGHVPAVDLAQAAIGPGMEVFSGFSQVIESDGRRMSVATALALINDKLHSILWDQEAEFDLETRAAIAWYDQYDWQMGDSARAEQIAMGKNTSIPRLVTVDIMWSKGGDTRLLRPTRFPPWSTTARTRRARPCGLPRCGCPICWRRDAGRTPSGCSLGVRSQVQLDAIVDLARLMFTIGEKRKRTDDQLRFNNLVTEWPELAKSAREYAAQHASVQPTLDEVIGHGG